jgi:hypothetical protein
MQKGRIKITYIIELFALALVIAVIVFVLQQRSAKTNSPETSEETNSKVTTNQGFDTNRVAQAAADDDGDGLTNDEETKVGTNPQKADSDGDGLTDYDEVKIYKSNPQNSDTDGDGNLDGAEVAKGYSPVDDSKLLDLDREKSKFTNQ